MLDYLVTSQSRKALLQALWKKRMQGSVRYLAQAAGLSFSSAYEELKEMEKNALAIVESHGNSLRYRANFQYPASALLLKLLDTSATRQNSSPALSPSLFENLQRLGAPLPITQVTEKILSIEETLARALKLARTDPSVARVLPIAFAKSKDRFDFQRLKTHALQLNEKRTLGFYLDLTGLLLRDPSLRNIAQELYDYRVKQSESFFVNAPKGKYLQKLESRNTPPLARKWHFRMNLGMDSLESQFAKHVS